MPESAALRRRVLAIASQFKLTQVEYLKALSKHFELAIAVHGEESQGFTQEAIDKGLQVTSIGRLGLQKIESRLRKLVDAFRPDVVHTLFHYNEELTVMSRRLVDQNTLVVHECRDPLTTMLGRTKLNPSSDPWILEREALQASDGQIFVSQAMRTYFEKTHGLDFSETSLVIPMCFCDQSQVAPPGRKLSSDDGRVHIVLDGTVSSEPNHGRYYVNIIRRLVSLGLVVHSYFHDSEGFSNPIYRDLCAELDDYHFHETISFSKGTHYSEALSRYDLMGVFHELDAKHHQESELLSMSMPTKAVSGWLSGGIPTVCFPHYKGIIEPVREFGIGFVAESWDDIARIAADRKAINRATEACLAHRHRFTTEWSAQRVSAFYERLLSRSESQYIDCV